jgi:tetratricopeptide (TPR) repeat protein
MRTGLAIVLLLACAAGLQGARERVAPATIEQNLLYVRSPEILKRMVLSYDALAADVYWIRTLQHFGRTRLDQSASRTYDLLFPLLDLTTSLDPHFHLAYRFGAIFLSEPSPGGAGRPDLAIALLEKGLQAQPDRWEFAQDIGFVHYWWARDYIRAADWFDRASRMPGAPNWMPPLVAVTRAEGGNRSSSRRLWEEILAESEEDWLRAQASFRLRQLDALDQIDQLDRVVAHYEQRTGSRPREWSDIGRAGLLRAVPVDPDGFEYQLDPSTGRVRPDPVSTINPLPTQDRLPQ